MAWYDDDVPTPIRVLSFILPIVLLGIVAYNVSKATTGSSLVSLIVLLIVSLAAAVCSLLIPGLKGYKKLVFSFVVCTLSTILAFSGVMINASKFASSISSRTTTTTSTSSYSAKDDLVDAPQDAVMAKNGYDSIVEYLTVNENTIRELYEDKTVYVNKRAQINKENENGGAALYVQRIKNDVTTLQNSYESSYIWTYDKWDAKNAWEDSADVKLYYYKEHGFVKAKEEYTDDTYYKVEKMSYVYYGDTGVKEKEEFRWIVSPSNGGESLFDCQLRVTHSYS